LFNPLSILDAFLRAAVEGVAEDEQFLVADHFGIARKDAISPLPCEIVVDVSGETQGFEEYGDHVLMGVDDEDEELWIDGHCWLVLRLVRKTAIRMIPGFLPYSTKVKVLRI